MKTAYEALKISVTDKVFQRMQAEFPYMLEAWNKECLQYNNMSDKDVGDCGENLSRFQVAVYGAGETIDEYMDDIAS